jgi:protein phosphatase
MPWSAKAHGLLRDQYAAVGAAAGAAVPAAVAALEAAAGRGIEVGELLTRQRRRAANARLFTAAYGRYCWPTDGLAGVRLAPFQILAGEGRAYTDRDHRWHLATIGRLVEHAPDLLVPTAHVEVDVTDAASEAAAVGWWAKLTGAGGEGMVVKPLAGLVRGSRGLVQPGVKCRGREYLRIIYGPDYTGPEYLDRLRERGLGHKRSLALREYALGLEALDRLARGEPLWRVHEAVFAVLALESEPVDPRL